MIRVRPFTDLAAMAVFRHLDPSDQLEAELVRGAPAQALGLFADWRAAAAGGVLNLVLETAGATPFAVLALGHTGQAGVAQAALLARDHGRFRRPLAEAAVLIRARMPGWCAERGIHRIEARCWAGHPTAAGLLTGIGFAHEADMPGFGADGAVVFRQFAWVAARSAPASPEPFPAPGATDPVCPTADPMETGATPCV